MDALTRRIESWVFGNRGLVLALGLAASQPWVAACFERQLPVRHPCMQTFLEHQERLDCIEAAKRLEEGTRARHENDRIGVGAWHLSALQSHADMGLLTFMFLVNMPGAVLVPPALAAVLAPMLRVGRRAARG